MGAPLLKRLVSQDLRYLEHLFRVGFFLAEKGSFLENHPSEDTPQRPYIHRIEQLHCVLLWFGYEKFGGFEVSAAYFVVLPANRIKDSRP